MITRNTAYLDETGAPSDAMLRSIIKEFQAGQDRLQRLRDYHRGRHSIDGRMRRRGLPNNRLSHDLPGYIVTTAAGYLAGVPIRYESDAPGIESVLSAYEATDVPSVDCELAVDASVYGRAVELCYADALSRPRVAQADPTRSFVVYGEDALHLPLLGVCLGEKRDGEGRVLCQRAGVYTAREALEYEGKGLTSLTLKERRPHFFGGVPLIEYWNNAEESGDFEGVLPLIDAYDALQSDRVNDKQQFTDAILVLYGVSGVSEGDGSAAQRLREEKTLCMPGSDTRVEFLTKQLSQSDTEVLKDSLKSDIHKLCLVPDLSDAQFAGNQSGVAMRYKLFGLEQLTRVKERWFREGLRERWRRFGYYLSLTGAQTPAAEQVRMIFTHDLPGMAD